jgi:hypothetical protein
VEAERNRVRDAPSRELAQRRRVEDEQERRAGGAVKDDREEHTLVRARAARRGDATRTAAASGI